jgi:hypothetical protein
VGRPDSLRTLPIVRRATASSNRENVTTAREALPDHFSLATLLPDLLHAKRVEHIPERAFRLTPEEIDQTPAVTLPTYFWIGRTPTRLLRRAWMPFTAANAPVMVVMIQTLWA